MNTRTLILIGVLVVLIGVKVLVFPGASPLLIF